MPLPTPEDRVGTVIGGRYRVEFGLESYEGRVAVELSSPPVLTLPLPEPPPDAGAEPSS